MKIWYLFFITPILLSCGNGEGGDETLGSDNFILEDSIAQVEPLFCNKDVSVGAARFDQYLPELEGQKVAIIGNQSSKVGETHLVDTLLSLNVNLVKVFSPEHGFRGDADAGEKVKDGKDPSSGLPVISLYGKNKKPSKEQLDGIDVLLFDIQDVGARFYTYISTLHYVLEAAAENNKKVIILDRPNPNGHYVDGPVLKEGYTSFVGMHEVPVVHGMTVGEYGQMIVGEYWLSDSLQCDLKVVNCLGWDHTKFYELPIAPSPNLPNMKAVYWYPSLCFFEGTVVSIGRGTAIPFQCVGHPNFEVDILEDLHSFKPEPNEGSKDPKLNGQTCYGYDLSKQEIGDVRKRGKLDLSYLIRFYAALDTEGNYFLSNGFIDLLSGSQTLRKAIISGDSEEEIRFTWEDDLEAFRKIRSKYLLYSDFE